MYGAKRHSELWYHGFENFVILFYCQLLWFNFMCCICACPNDSRHPNTKVEMLFHRSWRNTAASATAKRLGNTSSAESLCSPEIRSLLCILLYHLKFLLWLMFFVCGCGVCWLLCVSRYFSAVNRNRLKQVGSAILDMSIGLDLILVHRQSVCRWLSC